MDSKVIDFRFEKFNWLRNVKLIGGREGAAAVRVAVFIVFSFVFCGLFYRGVSPWLNSLLEVDSTVFKLVATGWLQGLTPYVDTFDHKGPYLYLIDMMGLKMSFDHGIYILSSLNLALTLELLWRIGRLYAKPSAILVGMALVLYTLYGGTSGNLTEDWCLTLSLLPLWLFLKALSEKDKTPTTRFRSFSAFIYGLCFGIIFFIRVNNGAIVAAIMLSLSVILLRAKDYSLWLRQCLFMALGFIVAVAPIVLYFYNNDALENLWFANFEFNALYLKKWGGGSFAVRIVKNSFRMIGLFVLMMMALRSRKLDKYTVLSLVIMILVGFVAFASGVDYAHYWIALTPLSFLAIVLVCSSNYKGYVKFLLVAACFVASTRVFVVNDLWLKGKLTPDNTEYAYRPVERMIRENVPSEHFHDVYSFNNFGCGAPLFLALGEYPAGKYWDFHVQYANVSQKVRDQIQGFHEAGEPQFIVSATSIDSKDVLGFSNMLNRYQAIDSVPVVMDNKIHKVFLYKNKCNGL